MTIKERLEEVRKNTRIHLCLGKETIAELPMRHYEYIYEQTERVQEFEKEFELYDIIHHKIGMTVNNPNTSDDEKWEEVNKLLSEAWESECIHCNGKGFNGLDYCPNCIRGEVIRENLELEQQNKRYREALEFYAICGQGVGETKHGEIARKALEGVPHESS